MARRNTPAPPRLRSPRLPELSAADGIEVLAHGTYEALAFSDDDLTGTDLSDVGFTDCSFTRLNVHELELTDGRITDSQLTRLDVPTVSAAYATLRTVLLEDSRLGVLQCIEGTWDTVRITGCKLGYVSLRGATVRDVVFEDCVIGELDLTGARAERLAFPGSELAVLDVSGATLVDVDLRALDLPEITGLAHLQGAALNHLQLQQLAPALAAHLGILVED
ncbi:pentapeptide repeat-containing protein [Kocuria sediminis]|uniref:Pentapeptide repeat-containing protein n=1 Tax=Kocuria sediminis TaxID=1038857 RepID=A0A6N8GSD3_9MICC|nr:pentapeptide repeat-containing protein [Kocuria sediminis]MUN63835.1 pentapeptide repeat-containing protein [Kocuria sediminis]